MTNIFFFFADMWYDPFDVSV